MNEILFPLSPEDLLKVEIATSAFRDHWASFLLIRVHPCPIRGKFLLRKTSGLIAACAVRMNLSYTPSSLNTVISGRHHASTRWPYDNPRLTYKCRPFTG